MNLDAFRLTHVISFAGVTRYAVASLGDEVFVPNCSSQIEVYDADNFTLQYCLTVPGLGPYCYGLVPCIRNNCLYASDWNNNSIHRVDLSDSNAVKWSVAHQPAGLSVNGAHNVVVTCHGVNKLQEYTTDGSLVREISLEQAGLTNPWHAVQLSTGDFVVSHNTSPGVVSAAEVHEGLIKIESVLMYDMSQTSDVASISTVGEMKNPACLAVTNHGDILVADTGNNRILSINTSLSSMQQLALPVDDGLKQPFGLCLYESRGRLYVCEYAEGRVLVFECML